MEPHYIKNIGNWKPDTQYELYLAKMSIKIMKLMEGASENHRVYCNQSNLTKPPEELQCLVFTSIGWCSNSLNALDASEPSDNPTSNSSLI